MPKKLTDLGIENLAAPKRRTFTADARCPGLFLVVQPTGKKSWIVARRLGGKFVKMKIGSFPAFKVDQARQEAERYIAAFDKGIDPQQVRREEQSARQAIQAETVAGIAENWLKRDQADKRCCPEVKRFIENRLIPAWGDRPITSITKRDCLAFVDKYADAGHVIRSRRIFSFLHRMFAWCVERDILTFNPMAGAKKLGSENSRDRVLSDQELLEVWKASDHLDGDPRRPDEPLVTNQYQQVGEIWGPIIKLLILTGARREEIGGLRGSELNLEKGFAKLPGDRTKRLPKHKDKPRLIYLSKKAQEIIEKVEKLEGCDFVFSTTGITSVSGWGTAKSRLDKLIKEARLKAGIKEDMPEWWLHDLRRTAATGFQRLGIRLEVTETVLGHLFGSRSGVVGVYQRYGFEKESREAVEIWANHVEDLLKGRFEEKILPMKKERVS